MRSAKNAIYLTLATGFGLGLSPVVPGTTGTLLGLLPVFGLRNFDWRLQLCAGVVMTLAAIPICGAAEKIYGKKDDHRIVADEYATFILCMLGLPWMEHLWLLPVCFVINRIMDIVKPAPARQVQGIAGGAGIVLDDVISSLYALAANWCVFLIVQRFVR